MLPFAEMILYGIGLISGVIPTKYSVWVSFFCVVTICEMFYGTLKGTPKDSLDALYTLNIAN